MHSQGGGAGGAWPNAEELGTNAVRSSVPLAPAGRPSTGRPRPWGSRLLSRAPAGPAPFKASGAVVVVATEVHGETQGSVASRGTHHACDVALTTALTSTHWLGRLVCKFRHRGAGPGKADYNSQHALRRRHGRTTQPLSAGEDRGRKKSCCN